MKKRTLKKELTILMLVASAGTLLSACVAILYVFFSFFIQNAQEDIEYVLNNTTQQFQSHMQFIEDGAVSIRHNSTLQVFFDSGEYDENTIESQLSYSMELFSERNMIDRQIPFVASIYLFNKNNDCITEHYYASTLATEQEQEARYQEIKKEFKKSGNQYDCVTDENSISLCFRIYDDDMEEKGICIADINKDAVRNILDEIDAYKDSTWGVLFHDEVILGQGNESLIKELVKSDNSWSGQKELGKKKVIGSADVCGFDVRTVITVGHNNIFSILQPTMLIFATVLVVVFIITIVLAFVTSYRFTKPVTRMIDSIQKFGEQDLDVRMPDSSIQEFHNIGNVFNEMTERIKYLIQQVYEKQILATQSQVKYLQAQVNPHFQFNILAMFSIRAKMAGDEELYEGLRAFSKLMQGKIFREKEIKIKVSEELEIVNFYLSLQQSRYQDKLSYEIKLDSEDINQDLIPRLLIEPLVENSVSHGLEPKPDAGRIKVHLYEEDEMLHVCIEDDGVGFDASEMKEVNENESLSEKIEHTHTGLENTKRMLQVLYGENHKFKISGKKGKGTRIEIIIPVERGEINVENHGG